MNHFHPYLPKRFTLTNSCTSSVENCWTFAHCMDSPKCLCSLWMLSCVRTKIAPNLADPMAEVVVDAVWSPCRRCIVLVNTDNETTMIKRRWEYRSSIVLPLQCGWWFDFFFCCLWVSETASQSWCVRTYIGNKGCYLKAMRWTYSLWWVSKS